MGLKHKKISMNDPEGFGLILEMIAKNMVFLHQAVWEFGSTYLCLYDIISDRYRFTAACFQKGHITLPTHKHRNIVRATHNKARNMSYFCFYHQVK